MAAEPLPTTLLRDRMPAWWRPFTVEPEGEPLARVRDGVEELRRALSFANAVDAVAYAFGDEAAGERIIDTVRSATPAVGGVQVAVGDAAPPAFVSAALADQLAVAPDSDLSTLISLLALSADYSERQPAIEGMRLADYAARQLEHRSASTRRLVLVCGRPVGERVGRGTAACVRDPFARRAPPRRAIKHRSMASLTALAARVDEIARADRRRARDRARAASAACLELHNRGARQRRWPGARSPAETARPMLAAVELAQRTHGTRRRSAPRPYSRASSKRTRERRGERSTRRPPLPPPALPCGAPAEAPPAPLLFPLASELARWCGGKGVRANRGRWAEPGGWDDARQREELAIAVQAYREVLALRLLGHE